VDKDDGQGGTGKKKEIFDIGLSFAVTRDRQIQVTHLVAGGPAAKLGFVSVGDVIVAIDDESIPSDSHADLGAFVQSRGQSAFSKYPRP
jgi:C-terminal processing protease CtpA/Prc